MAADQKSSGPVRVIPLGGIGEIGKNVTVIEQGDAMLLIDCGLTFPREEGMFGVDVVIPDFSYVVENAHKLIGVVITHGHEDHIGALPYLMREVSVPQVIATRFTLGLLKSRADEHGLVSSTEWTEAVPEEDAIQLGPFELEFVRVAHSIPDGVAVAVHTSEGTIFHTGDVKLDPSPLDQRRTDLSHVAELGADGVALYLADSTCADIPGMTGSEMTLASPLRDIVYRAPGRVVASCFSSHIHRIQQLVDIAHESGRAVCMLGRSLNRNTNIARNLGYLDAGGARFVKPKELDDIDPSEVMVLCTGSQGEPLAALHRIAWGSHPALSPDPLDTVILSSRTIPGNEIRVHRMVNELSRAGARIFHQENAKVHVSGHGSSQELATLLQLVQPAWFMPVHGEWRHLRAHAELAAMTGVDSGRVLMGENGRVVELRGGKASFSGEFVHVGQRLLDRHSNEELVERIVEDRQQLSGDGVLVVVARITPHDPPGSIEVIPRGVVDDDDVIVDEVLQAVGRVLETEAATHFEPERLEMVLQEAASSAAYEHDRRSPLIVPVVVQEG